MTFNNNNLPTTEPAFLSHDKYVRQRPRGFHKSLTDCCYSLSNLALIVACILAILFSVKFLTDDPLYEYGEHLLGLKFYRYIIFIVVILPLTLLVPIANAASAFYLSGARKKKLGTSVTGAKIIYQIILVILMFVGLVFIAPSIRHSNVANQMETEFRRHMKWRYDSEFSYEFLDRIQGEYDCCDELWYRSNYFDKIPLSCYYPDGTYSRIHNKSCSETLGAMVSERCIIIAACLVIIILALAILIGMGAVEMRDTGSSRRYDIRERQTKLMKPDGEPETTSLSSRRNSRDELDHCEERDELVEELTNRLKIRERERENPLLPKAGTATGHSTPAGGNRSLSSDDDAQSEDTGPASTAGRRTTGGPILTRANYHLYNNRPKSPVFVRTPDSGSLDGAGPSSSSYIHTTSNAQLGGMSPKSVLKKSSSFQKIDADSECEDDSQDQSQKPVQRDAQTRRSLLNVRFAD